MARGERYYEHTKNMPQAMIDIRDSMEPWHWSALWRKRGRCFYKVRRDGTIRLYRTGERLGFGWADLKMSPIRGGGTTMMVNTAAAASIKLLTWALCVVCLFMVAYDHQQYKGWAVVAHDWPYLALCAAAVALALITGRETPKLISVIEKELGWRRTR